MKKALLLTNASVDMALALSNWWQTHRDAVELTVVYAFSVNAPGRLLDAATYKEARQAAQRTLSQWLNFLPPANPSCLRAETILGSPQLVLSMYLLLRRYDYVLIDARQQDLLPVFRACQPQTGAQLRYLRLPHAAP